MSQFSHLNGNEGVQMVDITEKTPTVRTAVAQSVVFLGSDAFRALINDEVAKGDVLTSAQLAGIMGAKETGRLIPLCHPILINSVNLSFSLDEEAFSVTIKATVNTHANTGVEMEALTAVSVASLTIYDMCKSISKAIRITNIKLISKEGGVHGSYSVSHPHKQPRG
ncbi:MAG: cyclic pyranopterin monophosphate synthase MoaC [Bacteroidetes bacterium]|nr:cyclic pyranopterin monophosphate synthase MoaC [Bacteroidota bacterium]MCY4233978.1 cyclic pyranopterin monophosphate synthase MoaC [Bacteroidota bacterium]